MVAQHQVATISLGLVERKAGSCLTSQNRWIMTPISILGLSQMWTANILATKGVKSRDLTVKAGLSVKLRKTFQNWSWELHLDFSRRFFFEIGPLILLPSLHLHAAWGHHTEYWDHHAWVNIQYSAPQKLNIQYSGPKILNVQYSVAVRSGNIQHSPSSETQYSIFSGLKNSIFNILGDQKLNIQYSPISKLNIQYSNIRCGGLIVETSNNHSHN